MMEGRKKGSVDVTVPSYGYGRYLRQCVESVLAQDVEDLRVLILDDCSPDETPEVGAALAREDRRVTYVRHPANRGHIATFNEGIAWTTADYQLLLSADDHLLPGALARAVSLLEEHPDMSLCVGHARVLYADGRTREVRVDPVRPFPGDRVLSGADFVQVLVDAGANNTVVSATAVVRNRWLQATGGYRADMPHSGDLEMWLRLAAHGSVGLVDAPQAVYRRHSANMSDGYARDYGMGDLRQRRDAFDVFVAHAENVMPGATRMHSRLRHALAREAVGQASRAYTDGSQAASRRLMDFARETDPSIRFSVQRLKLGLKQLLGVERSRALMRWLSGEETTHGLVPPTGATRVEPSAGTGGPVQEP